MNVTLHSERNGLCLVIDTARYLATWQVKAIERGSTLTLTMAMAAQGGAGWRWSNLLRNYDNVIQPAVTIILHFLGLSGFLDIRLRQTEHKHSMTAIAQLDSLACGHGGGKAGWWLLLAVFLACSCISASENH